MRLLESLQNCTLALLRRISAAHGLPVEEDALRVELAQRVFERLTEPGYLEGYLAVLPQGEKEVLGAATAAGGRERAFVLDRRFPRPAGDASASGAGREEAGPSLSLLRKGLLFRTFASLGSWRGEVYYVPEELHPALAPFGAAQAERPRPDLRARAAPETVERCDPALDAFRLLSFLRREVRRSWQGFLSRSDLAKLAREAGGGPAGRDMNEQEARWRFLFHLCLAGGWVVRHGPVLRPGKGAAAFLSGSRGEVGARMLDRYLRDRSWSDLAAAGRVRQALGSRSLDEPTGRRLLLHHLEELAGADWIDEGALCRALRDLNPDLLRENYSSPAWGMVETASDAEVYGPGSWDVVEGGWIRHLLRGPLRWLGVVEWGATREGARVGFRLAPRPGAPAPAQSRHSRGSGNPAVPVDSRFRGNDGAEGGDSAEGGVGSGGAEGGIGNGGLEGDSRPVESEPPWALAGREIAGPPRALPGEAPQARISVLEDFRVAAPGGCDLGLLFRLEPYLEAGHSGGTARHALTRTSVLEGLEKGGSTEDLLDLLRPPGVEALPASVAARVEEWAAAYGRFTLEAGTLLTAATVEEAEKLKDVRGVAPCLLSRLGPRSYLIAPERVWELVGRLREAGHLPRVAPSARLQAARTATGERALLQESLFALLALRSLHPGLQFEDLSEAVRRLEALLGPEDAAEVARRAEGALARARRPRPTEG